MADVTDDQIRAFAAEARAALQASAGVEALESVRVRTLGRSGPLNDFMESLRALQGEAKKTRGKLLNEIKTELTALHETRKQELDVAGPAATAEDVTLPGAPWPLGKRHVLQRMQNEILGIFGSMGFEIVDGPEIEDEFHNFEALNIPPEHPARSPEDNFFFTGFSSLLRSQTSTVQIRAMEGRKPPVRVCTAGRVYRPDTVDATHHFCFHQVEGLVVESGIVAGDLIATLSRFARRFLGETTRVRFRPHYFPFTEVSAELDVACRACNAGNPDCPVCKGKGWMELLGCGMVHPNVFRAVGYDPEQVTGFAFGMGVERFVMARYGIHDIRYFMENDIRFLNQF